MILFVTTADTDLLTADRALEGLPVDFPEVKAFNPANLSGDGEQQQILEAAAQADAVVLRLLGGKRAMPEIFDLLVRLCHEKGKPLIACPGHQEWDQELVTACNVPPSELDAVFSYLIRGGVANLQNMFLFLSDSYLGSEYGHEAPSEVPWEGVYHPDVADGMGAQEFIQRRFKPDGPNVAVLFYRAHWMSGNLLTVDALIRRLEELGANVLPVYSFSLKHNPEGDGQANRTFTEILCDSDGEARVHCIINTMGMSMTDLQEDVATFATGPQVDYLDRLNVPIIQGIFSTGNEAEWEESSLGLGPIDTAMSVALPEILSHLGVELRPLNLVSRTPGIVCLGELEILPESLRDVPVVLGAYVWHAQPGWAPIDRLELERWLVDAPSGCHWLVSERKLVEMRSPPRRDDIALILWGPKRISQWLGTAVLTGELEVDTSPLPSETMVNVAERAEVPEPPPSGIAIRPQIQLREWFIEKGFEPLSTQPVLLAARLWTVEGYLIGPEDARERNSWTLLEDPFSATFERAGELDTLEHIPNLERLLPDV